MKTVVIWGKQIEYVHKKSDRRTISASVNKDGVLEVRSPKGVGDEGVRLFLIDNGDRVLRMMERGKARLRYENTLDEAALESLKKKAQAVIPERVRYYSAVMGLTPERVRINSAKTRFGSCSGWGNLNFSCRVMAYSAKAVDYVVIHELAHLVHMNHSPAFWAVVAKYMPDYKKAREELKQIPGYDD